MVGLMKKNDKEVVIRNLRKKINVFAKKIAPIYELLDWKWYIVGEKERRVPDSIDIAFSISDMIDTIKKGKFFSVSTGGITVSIETDEEKEGYALLMGSLEFKIDECVYGDDEII